MDGKAVSSLPNRFALLLISVRSMCSKDVFTKLLPLAGQFNARVVLVNRQDYPGAQPFTLEERAELLQAAIEMETDPLAAKERLGAFMREQAHEVYNLLAHLVAEHDVPPARVEGNAGGIVVAGWSFGAAWMMALLANVATFPMQKIDLSKYVRRVIIHGVYCRSIRSYNA